MSELNIREIVEKWSLAIRGTPDINALISEIEKAIEDNQAEWEAQPRGTILFGIKQFREHEAYLTDPLQVRIASLEVQLAGEKQAWKNGFTIGKHRAIGVLAGAEWGVGEECMGKIVPVIEQIIVKIREIKE